ncbi:hypothetical protein N9Q27_00060 [bacterium]|jgi:hypothetical protein|nr:hypothetical protein [bacterium]
MRFNEVSLQKAEDDDYGKWDIDDTRRPKLKLKHINKMRNMQEMRKKEHDEEVISNKAMYSQGEAE